MTKDDDGRDRPPSEDVESEGTLEAGGRNGGGGGGRGGRRPAGRKQPGPDRRDVLGRVKWHLYRASSCLIYHPEEAIQALWLAKEAVFELPEDEVSELIFLSLVVEIRLLEVLQALTHGLARRANVRFLEAEGLMQEVADPEIDAFMLAVRSLLASIAEDDDRAVMAARRALLAYQEAGAREEQLNPYRSLLAYLIRERDGAYSPEVERLEKALVVSDEPRESPDFFVDCLRLYGSQHLS